jgi:hypothetical protein
MLLTKLHGFSKVNVPSKSNVDWDKKVSSPKFKVKSFLREFWKNDVIVEEFVIPGSKFRIDLFNLSKKLAVEVSPDEYHNSFNKWLHKDRQKFLSKIKADELKKEWCIKNSIELVELFNEDINNLSVDYFEKKYNILLY